MTDPIPYKKLAAEDKLDRLEVTCERGDNLEV
jgi:hypothetical protein